MFFGKILLGIDFIVSFNSKVIFSFSKLLDHLYAEPRLIRKIGKSCSCY